ncbi:hypothetical protein HG530_000443 [Fusarium avenaceum]|nr:hypothetical protein HG530_000443 [Fusarium avenaceum]
MRSTTVPHKKIAGLSVDLDPFAAFVLQPLHSLVREAVPLLGPRPDSVLFILEVLVEVLAKEMCALADNQAAIIVAVREDVDETLQTAETRLQRVLVLMRPGLVGLDVFATWEGSVDGVEGHD